MKNNETFHKQDIVLTIALWAQILAWGILVLHLIDLANTVSSIASQWDSISLPPGLIEQAAAWGSLLDKPFTGLFYFLSLQGLAQLLYIGVDVYLSNETDEESAEA